jgi:hypothetical protein
MSVMPTDQIVEPSKEVSTRVQGELDLLVDEVGRRDGRDGINPMLGRPMVGQVEIATVTSRARTELLNAQGLESRLSKLQLLDARSRGVWLAGLSADDLPPELVPGLRERAAGIGITGLQYHIRTKGLGGLAVAFLGAEFLVVVEPFNALLESGVGLTRPAVACAGAATAIVGVAAHARERFGRSADVSKAAGDQSAEARAVSLHNIATTALLVGVGLSTAARATQAYYSEGVSITNLSAFVALQLLFLLAALVFPALQRHLLRDARADVLAAHVEAQRLDTATAEEATTDVAAQHEATLADFDAGADVRSVRYLTVLADALLVPYLADLVRREAWGIAPSRDDAGSHEARFDACGVRPPAGAPADPPEPVAEPEAGFTPQRPDPSDGPAPQADAGAPPVAGPSAAIGDDDGFFDAYNPPTER